MGLDLFLLLSLLIFDRLLHNSLLHCMVFVLIVMDVAPMIHIHQFFQVILHVANVAHYLIEVTVVVFYTGILIVNLSNHRLHCFVIFFHTSVDNVI